MACLSGIVVVECGPLSEIVQYPVSMRGIVQPRTITRLPRSQVPQPSNQRNRTEQYPLRNRCFNPLYISQVELKLHKTTLMNPHSCGYRDRIAYCQIALDLAQ